MYNSGVIGLAPADFHLLREALQWTDNALPFGQPHTLEQLALSLSLGKDTDVRTVDDTVHHYWNQRPQYNAAISQLLSEIRDRKMSPASAVQYVVEHVPQIPPFCKPGLLARLWRKVIGRTAFSTLRIKEEIERTYRVDG
jgi:hypothetical protein